MGLKSRAIYPHLPLASLRLFFWLTLTLSVVAGAAGLEDGGLPRIESFAGQEVTEGNACWTAVRSPEGDLALGTSGISLYNGLNWEKVESLTSNAIRALAYDKDGLLWVGGTNELGFVKRNAAGTPVFHSLRELLPRSAQELGDIWQVFPRPDGRILWITHNRVLSYQADGFRVWDFPGQRRLLAFLHQGEVKLHYRSTGILRLAPSGPLLEYPSSGLPLHQVVGIERFGTRDFAVTSGGLFALDDPAHQIHGEELASLLREGWLTSYVRKEGRLFFGTLNSGLIVASETGEVLRVLDAKRGLPSNTVYFLSEDPSGLLWVGTSTRLYHLDPGFRSLWFDARDGLEGSLIAKTQRIAERLYVVTDTGVFRTAPGLPAEKSRFERVPGLEGRFLDISSVGKEIVLGKPGALVRWKDGKVEEIQALSEDVFNLWPSHFDPTVHYCAVGYSVHAFRLTGKETLPLWKLELPDIAQSMVELSHSKLLISTFARGAYLFERTQDGLWRRSPLASKTDFVQGKTWVVEAGGSAFFLAKNFVGLFDERTQRWHPLKNHPPGVPLAAGSADEGNELWIAWLDASAPSPRRQILGFFRRVGRDWLWRTVPLPELSSLSGIVQTIYAEGAHQQESLWLGTSQGLARFDATALRRPPPQPLVRILACGLAGGSLEPLKEPSVPMTEPPFSNGPTLFEYASPNLEYKGSLLYQTRLFPASESWSEPSPLTRREWTGLREGDYRFEVRALVDGLEGPASHLTFEIAPPWYRHPAAYLAYGVIAYLCFHLAVHWRTRLTRLRNLELERQIALHTREIARMSQAKSDFISGISHEIRNPLNGIQGLSNKLGDLELPPEADRDLRNLQLCARHLSSLVEHVLDFARIESGTQVFEPNPVRLSEMLDTIRAVVEDPLAKAGMRLDLRPAADLPPYLVLDDRKVRQVVINYIQNAIKYAGTGKVLVDIETRQINPEEGALRFVVSDEGQGVPKEEQEHIFERYSRGSEAKKKRKPGSGIGLAVCRGFATCMGGQVGLTESRLKGASFFLEIPFKIAREDQVPVPSDPPELLGRMHLQVLLVDDLTYNLDLLAHLLGEWDVTIERAEDGPSALALLQSKPFDVVFLDLDLPGFGGEELVARYLRGPRPGDPPWFVATTAFATLEKQQECKRAGFSAFVSKPVSREAIYQAFTGLGSSLLKANSIRVALPTLAATPLRQMASGDPNRWQVLARRFVQDLEVELDDLQAALRAKDFAMVRRHAHRLRSSAALAGSEELATQAARLESLAPSGAIRDLEDCHQTLRTSAGQLKERLLLEAESEEGV